MNSENKFRENIIPGDLTSEIDLEDYNDIVKNSSFAQNISTIGREIYIIIENNNIFKLINNISLSFEGINILSIDDILEIKDFSGIKNIVIQSDILTSDISIFLREICINSIKTEIFSNKPKLFLEYSLLNDSLKISFLKSNSDIRKIILELLIYPSKKEYKNDKTKNVKSLQNIFNSLDVNTKYNMPFYRFEEKYLLLESLTDVNKNLISEGEIDQLFESKDYGWIHNAYLFVTYTEIYGLERCIDKVNLTSNRKKLLLSGFILTLIVDKGLHNIENSLFSETCFHKIEMAFNYRFKTSTKNVIHTIKHFQDNECKILNSLKVKDKLILNDAGLITNETDFQYNYFTTLLNNYYINEKKASTTCTLNEQKAFKLMHQFNKDNRCIYSLDMICRTKPILLCSEKNFSNQLVFESWATHIACFLIIYNVPKNTYEEIKELFSFKNFKYPKKYLLLQFLFTRKLPNGFSDFCSFYTFMFSECNKSLSKMCSNTNYGIPDPFLPIFCSFIKTYGTEIDYRNVCYLIFSFCPSYKWVFNKCSDTYFNKPMIEA